MAYPDAETVRLLYAEESKNVREIALLLRCRKQTVLAVMEAAGISRRRRGRARAPLPDWDQKKLRQLARAQGMAYARAFARRHGVNREKLAVLLDRRLLMRGKRLRCGAAEYDDAIRAAYEAGVPIKTLAARYDCTRRAISYSLDRTSGTKGQ
jgi:hypothetical protein